MEETNTNRSYETFKRFLDKESDLGKIFIEFCELTTFDVIDGKYEFYLFEEKSIPYNDFVEHIWTDKIVKKSKAVIKSYLDELIKYGLVCYDGVERFEDRSGGNVEGIFDNERLKYYKELNVSEKDINLILTGGRMYRQYTGKYCYGRYLKELDEEREENEWQHTFQEAFISAAHEALDPEIDKIKNIANITEKKLQEVEKEIKQNTVKNIEVLSVFVAVITFAFGGITSLQYFKDLGLEGVLVLNASVVMGIFALLVLVEVIIVKEPIPEKVMNIVREIFIIFLLVVIAGNKSFWNWIVTISDK